VHGAYLDETVTRFDREIQFYVAYLAYIAPIRQAGLRFCHPTVSATSKAVHARETFDLALAAKLVSETGRVVTMRCSCERNACPMGRARSGSWRAHRWRRVLGRTCTGRCSMAKGHEPSPLSPAEIRIPRVSRRCSIVSRPINQSATIALDDPSPRWSSAIRRRRPSRAEVTLKDLGIGTGQAPTLGALYDD